MLVCFGNPDKLDNLESSLFPSNVWKWAGVNHNSNKLYLQSKNLYSYSVYPVIDPVIAALV